MVYYKDMSNRILNKGVKYTNVIMCGWVNTGVTAWVNPYTRIET